MKVFIGLLAASWVLCSTVQAQHSTPTDDQLTSPTQRHQRAVDSKATKAASKQQASAGKQRTTTEQPSGAVDKAAQRAMRADKKRTRSTMQ
jgi:hypothetical protein